MDTVVADQVDGKGIIPTNIKIDQHYRWGRLVLRLQLQCICLEKLFKNSEAGVTKFYMMIFHLSCWRYFITIKQSSHRGKNMDPPLQT